MNPRHLRTFLNAAGMAFALPALTTQAFAARVCGQPDAPGMMPPHPGMPGGPGDMCMGDGPRPPMRGPQAGGLPSHLRGLDLSVAQQDRIQEIQCGLMSKLRPQTEDAERARHALRELTMSDAYDEAKAKCYAEVAGAAMTRLALEQARADQAVFQVLTAEQKARLKERGNCPMPGFGPPMPRGF